MILTKVYSFLVLHVPTWVDAEQAGGDLLDGQAAELPAVEDTGESAPMGAFQLETAQAFGVFGVAGGLFDEPHHVSGQTADHTGGERLAAHHAFHRPEDGEEVLHHVVGEEAGFGGGILVGDVGLALRVLLLDEEVDDMAVRYGLGVLLCQLCIDVGGVGHAAAVHHVVVAHEVGLRVNHADAEEGLAAIDH